LQNDLHPYTAHMWGRHHLVEYLPTVAASAVAVVIIMNFVAMPYRVAQTSMQNTLQPGEHVLVDKITPNFTGFHRGDIVIFKLPNQLLEGHDDTAKIKRLIGLPGETVDIGPDGVRVNGVLLEESYVFVEDFSNLEENRSWNIGKDELLVLGDHRTGSTDSRTYGPIPTSAVIGRAVVRFYPVDRFSIIVPPAYSLVP
jgi:signal peptidase I